LAAASKAAADKAPDAEDSPVAPAGKPDTKQKGKPLDVIDLLTPVDLIKKSSANRLKQKQTGVHGQQDAASEVAPADLAKTAPAGRKVATRGRNANLQVVEVEPKAKRGKRKAASESADKLATGIPAEEATPAEDPEQDEFLPNRKRSKPGKSAALRAGAPAGADAAAAQLQQLEAAGTTMREVPGLPGVKHQMPKIATAAAMAVGVAKPASAAANTAGKTAALENHSQSGPAKSNNSMRQASSGKAASGRAAAAAKSTKPASGPARKAEPAEAEAVDKPADRSVAVALQPTLASAGASQGMQFQILQVSCYSLLFAA